MHFIMPVKCNTHYTHYYHWDKIHNNAAAYGYTRVTIKTYKLLFSPVLHKYLNENLNNIK